MAILILAVLLYGMTHPGAAILLSTSKLSIVTFTFSFLVIRVLVQSPLVIKQSFNLNNFKKVYKLLVLSGVCGAGLHFLEFKSLTIGLPVSLITFLIFIHPVWSLLIKNFILKEEVSISEIIKLIVGLIGIIIIVDPINFKTRLSWNLLYPLCASAFMSGWIMTASEVQKHKFGKINFSFFYDLFSLVGIVLIFHNELFLNFQSDFIALVESPVNILKLCIYTIVIGLVPNLLVYYGIENKGAVKTSYVLLLEPVVSSVYSAFMFGEKFTLPFYVGAFLLLLMNSSVIDKILNMEITKNA